MPPAARAFRGETNSPRGDQRLLLAAALRRGAPDLHLHLHRPSRRQRYGRWLDHSRCPIANRASPRPGGTVFRCRLRSSSRSPSARRGCASRPPTTRDSCPTSGRGAGSMGRSRTRARVERGVVARRRVSGRVNRAGPAGEQRRLAEARLGDNRRHPPPERFCEPLFELCAREQHHWPRGRQDLRRASPGGSRTCSADRHILPLARCKRRRATRSARLSP